MEFIIDTVDLNEIKEAVEYLAIVGVTSNPSIIKKLILKIFGNIWRMLEKIIGKQRSLHMLIESAT